MFFLIRAAFWLGVLVLLLPGDSDNGNGKQGEAPRVTALQAISAAGSAVSDVSQFCERKPDVCATGGAALQVLAEKVGTGIRLISSHMNDGKSAKPGEASTLTPDDMKPILPAAAKRNAASAG